MNYFAKRDEKEKGLPGLLQLVAWGDDVWTKVLLPFLFFSLFGIPSVRPQFVLCLPVFFSFPGFPYVRPLVVVCVSRSPTVSSVSWVFLRSSSHCVPVPPRLSLCPLIPPLFWFLFFSIFFLLSDGCFVAFCRGLCVLVF